MVKAESYEFKPNKMPSAVVDHSGSVGITKLERAANGSWFANIILSLAIELKDGRKVTVNKQVRLRGAQEGKRPHPDPFGWKKKHGKRTKK